MRNTEVYVAQISGIDKGYKDVLDFTYTGDKLNNYIISKSKANAVNFSFVRENVVSVPFDYNTVLNCNYIMFQNTSYSSKWFYGWIDRITFVSGGCVEIEFTIDIWNTWKNELVLNQVYVEREHTNDDTIGNNLIPESVYINNYVTDLSQRVYPDLNNKFFIIIESTYDINNNRDFSGIRAYDGTLCGVIRYAFLMQRSTMLTDAQTISTFINNMSEEKLETAIQGIYIAPYESLVGQYNVNTHEVYFNRYNTSAKIIKLNTNEFDNYGFENVKNNKLKTYPFSFIRVSNNAGSYNDYKKELMLKQGIEQEYIFEVQTTVVNGLSGYIYSPFYKGETYEINEAVAIGKLPTVSYASPYYTNWLAQNSVNFHKQILGSALNITNDLVGSVNMQPTKKGLQMGNPISSGIKMGNAVVNAQLEYLNFKDQVHRAKMIPNNVSDHVGNGDVKMCTGALSPVISRVRVSDEDIERIDNYFTRYGYAINDIKYPNTSGRKSFNYVKVASGENTFKSNIIDSDTLNEINNIFSGGVTLWHDIEKIGIYEDNEILIEPV